MYTKVAEAVDLLASMGGDINCSIMGSGSGYHEASAEEIALSKQNTPEGQELLSRMGELNGNEKYYYLPESLPTNSQRPGNIGAQKTYGT